MYVKDDADYDNYFEDTMKAGHYENDKKSVEIMIRSSRDVVKDLIASGADFKKDEMVILHIQGKVPTAVTESYFTRM